MKNMNMSEEDLDNMTNELMENFGGLMNPEDVEEGDDESFEPGGAMQFPFLNNVFGSAPNGEKNDEKMDAKKDKKEKI